MSATVPPPPAGAVLDRAIAYLWRGCSEPLQFDEHATPATCVECGSLRLEVALTERGEVICRSCGENVGTLVVENDRGEWSRPCGDCDGPTEPMPVAVTESLTEFGVCCPACGWSDF